MKKNLDHEIFKLIEAQPAINNKDIAYSLSIPEELVKMHIENFNDVREKILIMSYERSFYDIFKAALELENYNVVKAPGDSSALETVKNEKPDLILLDTGHLDIDCFEICRQLKASSRYWQIPVIMLIEKDEVKDRIKAFDSGADGYITAPFNSQELKARVEMLLKRTRVLSS